MRRFRRFRIRRWLIGIALAAASIVALSFVPVPADAQASYFHLREAHTQTARVAELSADLNNRRQHAHHYSWAVNLYRHDIDVARRCERVTTSRIDCWFSLYYAVKVGTSYICEYKTHVYKLSGRRVQGYRVPMPTFNECYFG